MKAKLLLFVTLLFSINYMSASSKSSTNQLGKLIELAKKSNSETALDRARFDKLNLAVQLLTEHRSALLSRLTHAQRMANPAGERAALERYMLAEKTFGSFFAQNYLAIPQTSGEAVH